GAAGYLAALAVEITFDALRELPPAEAGGFRDRSSEHLDHALGLDCIEDRRGRVDVRHRAGVSVWYALEDGLEHSRYLIFVCRIRIPLIERCLGIHNQVCIAPPVLVLPDGHELLGGGGAGGDALDLLARAIEAEVGIDLTDEPGGAPNVLL